MNDAKSTVSLVSEYLQAIISLNDNVPASHSLTRFHAKTVPCINLSCYLLRILKYSPASSECFLALLIYLERLSLINENGWVVHSDPLPRTPLILNSYNCHRLVISGILVSIKFLSDVFYTNAHMASKYNLLIIIEVGGITVGELNKLELEFLILLDFDLYVSETEISNAYKRLEMFGHDKVPMSPLVYTESNKCISPLALTSPVMNDQI